MTSLDTALPEPVAIILAAGAGRRAGGFKPLWPLGDRVVIDAVIGSARSVCALIRVVGGAEFERLEKHLARHHPGVELVNNEDWERGGMFSSVRLGVRGLDGPAFVHPCDVPGADARVYRLLEQEYRPGVDDAVRPVHRGRGGHPVLLSPEVLTIVRDAPGSATLREALAGFRRRDVELDDDLACVDFDTRAEYLELAERLAARERTKGER
jgi:CTP:molybdopterin cytidylyltransferase MocA